MRKYLTSLIIVILFTSITASLYVSSLETELHSVKNDEIDDAIRVDSSSDFREHADEKGWEGNGSKDNPIVIEDLKIEGSSDGYCIYVGNTSLHFVIKDCHLSKADNNDEFYHWNSGLVIYNCKNGRIENISSTENAGAGIYVSKSEEMIISESKVLHNRHGIFLNRANSNNFSGNTVCGNERSGLYLYHSYFNLLENSSVSLTREDGVYCLHSNDNIFSYNRFSNNNCSIHFYQSNNNFIHHNNFFYNKKTLDYCENNWDNGYPSGGNHWSFLDGIDDKKGDDQTKDGSDGIIDESYHVPVKENIDRYPLKEPVHVDLDFRITTPKAPLDLSAREDGDRIIVKWRLPLSDGGSPIHTYRIYRSSDEELKFYRKVEGNSTRFIDEDVDPGKEYSYKVTSVNEEGESERSGITTGKVREEDLIPGYPILVFVIVLLLITRHVDRKK